MDTPISIDQLLRSLPRLHRLQSVVDSPLCQASVRGYLRPNRWDRDGSQATWRGRHWLRESLRFIGSYSKSHHGTWECSATLYSVYPLYAMCMKNAKQSVLRHLFVWCVTSQDCMSLRYLNLSTGSSTFLATVWLSDTNSIASVNVCHLAHATIHELFPFLVA